MRYFLYASVAVGLMPIALWGGVTAPSASSYFITPPQFRYSPSGLTSSNGYVQWSPQTTLSPQLLQQNQIIQQQAQQLKMAKAEILKQQADKLAQAQQLQLAQQQAAARAAQQMPVAPSYSAQPLILEPYPQQVSAPIYPSPYQAAAPIYTGSYPPSSYPSGSYPGAAIYSSPAYLAPAYQTPYLGSIYQGPAAAPVSAAAPLQYDTENMGDTPLQYDTENVSELSSYGQAPQYDTENMDAYDPQQAEYAASVYGQVDANYPAIPPALPGQYYQNVYGLAPQQSVQYYAPPAPPPPSSTLLDGLNLFENVLELAQKSPPAAAQQAGVQAPVQQAVPQDPTPQASYAPQQPIQQASYAQPDPTPQASQATYAPQQPIQQASYAPQQSPVQQVIYTPQQPVHQDSGQDVPAYSYYTQSSPTDNVLVSSSNTAQSSYEFDEAAQFQVNSAPGESVVLEVEVDDEGNPLPSSHTKTYETSPWEYY